MTNDEPCGAAPDAARRSAAVISIKLEGGCCEIRSCKGEDGGALVVVGCWLAAPAAANPVPAAGCVTCNGSAEKGADVEGDGV